METYTDADMSSRYSSNRVAFDIQCGCFTIASIYHRIIMDYAFIMFIRLFVSEMSAQHPRRDKFDVFVAQMFASIFVCEHRK